MESEVLKDFQFNTPETESMRSDDLEEVRKAEKKLKRKSYGFLAVGLITLIAGGALLASNITGLLGTGELYEFLTVAGVMGAFVGGFQLFRNVLGKKVLNFPPLKLLRKSMKNKSGMGPDQKVPEARPFEETSYVRKKLTKSYRNRVFLGVAGGIAEYAGINPALLRMLLVITFFISASTVVIPYLILSLVLPVEKDYSR